MPILLQAQNFQITARQGILDSRAPGGTPAPAPPVWAAIPDRRVNPGASFSVANYASDANDDPLTFSRQGGTAPAGVTVSAAGIVTVPGDTPVGDYTVIVGADDGSVASAAVTTLTLRSSTGGIKAWTAGLALAEGDMLPGELSALSGASQFQANELNRWPDGSVKFAVLSGVSTVQAGIDTVVEIGVGGLRSAGTVAPITAADVGDTFISFDGVNITLASAIAGADLRSFSGSAGVVPPNAGIVRDWHVGAVMRETHYYAPVASKPGLCVFWYVRKYATGAVEIETVVEYGWFGIAATTSPVAAGPQYVVSVTVNGTQRPWHDGLLARSISSLWVPSSGAQYEAYHAPYTRWSRVDWVGTDPALWVIHDTDYLTDTWLVPNYGWPVATDEAAFATDAAVGRALSDVTDAEVRAPTPLNRAFWRSSQAGGGEETFGQIGLLPSWDGVYLRTRDIRALRAVLLNARAWQFIPTWRRDERTLGLPRTDDATVIPNYNARNAEREHQPSTGYLAYLLTGRYLFLECCLNTALWNFFKTPTAAPWPRDGNTAPGRDGLEGLLTSGETAARAVAWPWRSLATALCVTPDAHPLRADLQFVFEANIEYFWGLQRDATAMANDLGIVWCVGFDDFASSANPPAEPLHEYVRFSSFMSGFLSSAIGFSRGLKLVSGQSATDLQSLHEFSLLAVIGRLGDTHDGSGYSWRRCSTYYEPVGEPGIAYGSGGKIPASFLASWRLVYLEGLDYWGAVDEDDSDPVGTSVFVTPTSGGAFLSGPGKIARPLDTVSDDINSIPNIIPTRSMVAPLAIGADYGVPGALAAYAKFVGSRVYADNAMARQLIANAPKYQVTPR